MSEFKQQLWSMEMLPKDILINKIKELEQALEEIKKIADETLWNYPTLDDVRVYQNLEKISRITEDFVDEEDEDD